MGHPHPTTAFGMIFSGNRLMPAINRRRGIWLLAGLLVARVAGSEKVAAPELVCQTKRPPETTR